MDANKLKDTKCLQPLANYLRDISEVKILTPRQERDLFTTIYNCEQTLIRANLRLVVSVAKKYMGKGFELNDLIQEGNKGLINAVKLFDIKRGNRLTTYLVPAIKNRIERMIWEERTAIRKPTHTKELIPEWINRKIKLRYELKREPTNEEITESLCWDAGKVEKVLASLATFGVITQSDYEYTFDLVNEAVESIIDTEQPPVEKAANNELSESLKAIISKLPVIHRIIIECHYGLNGQSKLTLNQISKILGVTRERIRQIEASVLDKLREMVR